MSVRENECEYYVIVVSWNLRDTEVFFSKSINRIRTFAAQFDDPDKFDEVKPLLKEKKIEIHKLYAGKERGPKKTTVINLFGISQTNQRRLKITNIDKTGMQLRLGF